MPRRRVLPLLGAAALAVAIGSCGDGAPTGPPGPTNLTAAAASITAADVFQRVALLADDSMLGRWTPSPQLEEAAAYVESEFRRLGLHGALSGGAFQQRFPADAGSAPTVIGVLDGDDPALRGEFVLIVAHMDHLGVEPGAVGDSIYNGADDNASGTAGVLELAEAFAGLNARPPRSIVFIAFGGEERGLWGSSYYVANPPLPLAQTVALINLDMISRNQPHRVSVATDRADLSDVVNAALAAHPELDLQVQFIPDPGRSDHAPFARQGVPTLLFHAGLHEDYHQVSDSADLIDPAKAARVVQLAFHVALEIARRPGRPTARVGGTSAAGAGAAP